MNKREIEEIRERSSNIGRIEASDLPRLCDFVERVMQTYENCHDELIATRNLWSFEPMNELLTEWEGSDE